MKKLLFLVLALFIIGNTVSSQTFTYSLNTSVTPINNGGAQYDNYDGYWHHDNNNDTWDGTGIGEGSPGGISKIDDYWRFQDAGNPEDGGFSPGDNGNRKLQGYCNLSSLGGTTTMLDDGVTIHFVARVPTDGLLDSIYNRDGSVIAYPEGGKGYSQHNDGALGMIGIAQGTGFISFCLRTVNDSIGNDGNNIGVFTGLQMPPAKGNAIITGTDITAADTINTIPLDVTEWHDFWVNIVKDPTGVGTHKVSVSVDGGEFQVFSVTATNHAEVATMPVLRLGLGNSDMYGAFDIKAFDFAPGLLEPPAMPVAHWACEGDATDEYGTSDGTLINGDTSSYVEGVVGQALDLASGSPVRYIEVPDNDKINFDTNSFTISMLVNIPDFAGTHELIYKGDNAAQWWAFALHDNALMMFIDDNVADYFVLEIPNIDQKMNAGEWTHIVAIRDRELDKLIIYVNGQEVGSINDPIETSISSSGLSLRIGTNRVEVTSEQRQIDEILLYNVALSPEEISSLYNSYFPKEIPDNVVAYWKLDGDATDERGTSDGTLMGGADTNYVEGLNGQALDLSKGTDPTYIEVADNSVINLDTSDFTYSLLLNVPDFASNREIIFKGTTAGEWYAIALIENTLRFFVDDNITNTNLDFEEANLHLYDSTWNHIAAIRDRSQDSIFLYINQRMVGSLKDDTEESIGSTLPLIIGAGGNKDVKFDGMLDEVRLYNEALSLLDLKSLSREYGIDAPYIQSTNANLSSMSIIPSSAILTPAFDPNVTEYSAVVPEGTATVRVNAFPADFKSKITGTGVNYDISSGSVTVEIVVTAENGTTVKTYTIDFTITGIDEIFGKGSKVIYNPIENCLIFINIDNISRVEVYNIAGMKLIEKNNVSERMSLNSANLKGNAVFFVRIISENEYGVMKFVK